MARLPNPMGPRTFDDAKLAQMVEPLKVRIERIQAGKRTPVPVWESNSGSPDGAGFSKEEIAQLEQNLLLTWSGGGLYEITVTDNADPPTKMSWCPWWDPNLYPQQVPPPLRDAMSPDAVIAQQQSVPSQPQGPQRMPPIPPFGQNPFFQAGGYQMPPPPMVGSPQYPHWRDEAERQEQKAEAKKLREENDRREREAIEARHKAELERERMANNERFSRLENAITGLMSTLKESAAAPKGPSPELLAMQAQLAELKETARKAEERADAARRDQEAERRENMLRDQMRQQADDAKRAYEATQRQIETMNQQFQTMIANLTTQMTNAANKSDPLHAVMQEQARQNAETIREIARENRAQMEKFQAFMMNPRDLLAMARESQEGVEKAIERTTRFTDNVVNMQQKVLENALAMQPQGGGAIEAVREGIGSVKEIAERWLRGKSQEAVTQVQAQADMARSQAHIVEVQARAANPAAFAPPPGLSGPPIQVVDATAEQPAGTAIPQPPAERQRLWGRTDREWFGPLLNDVLQLRAGVAQFHEACEKISSGMLKVADEREIPGTHARAVAEGVAVVAAMAQTQGIIVPAMIELLIPGLYAEFVSTLIPDASEEYRNAVIKLLKDPAGVQADQAEDEGEEDEDEPAAPPARPAKAKNGKAARA